MSGAAKVIMKHNTATTAVVAPVLTVNARILFPIESFFLNPVFVVWNRYRRAAAMATSAAAVTALSTRR